jgi:GT2 family glycosyltransferase
MISDPPIGIVVIGRNEGNRLKPCLASLAGGGLVVYVDSGSDDGSLDYARAHGFEAIALSADKPFTAARARNAGIARLLELRPDLLWAQTVDGDCTLHPRWLAAAVSALTYSPNIAIVFGRLRERRAGSNIYLRLCDDEWNVPLGETESCGGIAMHRIAATRAAGGFDETLIAGEEPDLCLRLRKAGWSIHRIDAEMGEHDAAIERFGQWWRRAVRSGHAFIEHVWRNGRESFPGWKIQVARFTFWGFFWPVCVALLTLALLVTGRSIWFAMLPLVAYALQFARLAWRNKHKGRDAWAIAALAVVAKFAEALGAVRFMRYRLFRKRPELVEYKD